MVGGWIVSIQERPGRLRIIVADQREPGARHRFLGVDVVRTVHPLALGDSLWWQGNTCFWTPEGESRAWDVRIPKIGNSFAVGLDA